MMNRHPYQRCDNAAKFAFGFGFCLLTGAAYGDVKIVAKVTTAKSTLPAAAPTVSVNTGGMTSAPAPSPASPAMESAQVVTTYYKGADARVETDGGLVTLYNGGDKKAYTLDTTQKTYYVQPFKDITQPALMAAGGHAAPMQVTGDISVTAGDGTRPIGMLTGKVFIVSGSVTVSPQRAGGGGRSGVRGGGFGGRHRGGGFPSGGGGNCPGGGGGYPGSAVRSRTTEISGEYWLSDALKLPSDKKATLLPAVAAGTPPERSVFQPLADALGKKKDLPLDSRITLTHTDRQTLVQESVTTKTEVQEISQDPLPDALFRLPVGYTQVAPPAAVPSAP